MVFSNLFAIIIIYPIWEIKFLLLINNIFTNIKILTIFKLNKINYKSYLRLFFYYLNYEYYICKYITIYAFFTINIYNINAFFEKFIIIIIYNKKYYFGILYFILIFILIFVLTINDYNIYILLNIINCEYIINLIFDIKFIMQCI